MINTTTTYALCEFQKDGRISPLWCCIYDQSEADHFLQWAKKGSPNSDFHILPMNEVDVSKLDLSCYVESVRPVILSYFERSKK